MHGVRVVDGHPDLEAVLAVGADPQHRRKDEGVADPPVVVLLRAALQDAALDDAVAEEVEADLHLVPRVPGRRAGAPLRAHRRQVVAVQPLDVRGVDAVLHDLQPVAGYQRAPDVPQHAVPHEQVVAGQQRRGLGTEVGEDQPAELLHAKGPRPRLLQLLRARSGLRGHAQAASRGVVLPAVVRARDPLAVDLAAAQGRAAVGARLVEQPQPPVEGAEDHEVLAQQTDCARCARDDLVADGNRVPIAPQQLAHRRAAADPRQPLLSGSVHGASTSP